MQGSTSLLLYRSGKSIVQGYLAYQGCRHLLYPALHNSELYVSNCERTGWIFVAFNVVDEVAAIINGDGLDSHVHHILCVAVGAANFALMRTTQDYELRRTMTNVFMVLLANECVTPAFNVYAFLKQIGQHNSLKALLVLISIIPMLKFRVANSMTLLLRLLGGGGSPAIVRSFVGLVFRWSISGLCIALVVLDMVWMRWALGKIYRVSRTMHLI